MWGSNKIDNASYYSEYGDLLIYVRALLRRKTPTYYKIRTVQQKEHITPTTAYNLLSYLDTPKTIDIME